MRAASTTYPSNERIDVDVFDGPCCAACAALGGRHAALSPAASSILALWDDARTTWTRSARCLPLELVLLTALERRIATAALMLTDALQSERHDRDTARARAVAAVFEAHFGSDVAALHSAWDEAAVCPLGLGTPSLGLIRPDLPLQEGYRALSTRARLVFLTFAPEAGHRPVHVDAGVLARRCGLDVATVHLALCELGERRWLQTVGTSGARIASPTPFAFLGLGDGPWAARRLRR